MPWSRWVREEDHSRLGRLLQQGLERSIGSEIELVSATGETVQVQLSLSLLQTAERKNITALLLDVRLRQRTEEALRGAPTDFEEQVIERTGRLAAANEQLREESAERKRAEARLAYQVNVLANVHDAVLATDDRLNLTAWNRAAEQIYGWKAEEVLGRNIDEVIRSEFTAAQQAGARQALEETGHYHAEMGQYRRDGARLDIEGDTVALHDEEGRMTGYVYAFRDVTERKRAQTALQDSEELFGAVFENSVSAIALTDLEGRFVKVNRAFQQLLGYSEPELLATTCQDISHPDDPECNQSLTAELLNGRRNEYQLTSRRRRKDGRLIWVRVSASLIPAADGKPRFVMKVVEDITEQVEAQQLLEHRVEERTGEIERRRQVAEGLHEFLKSLNAKRPLNEVLQQVVAQACRLLHTDICAIYEIEPGNHFLWVRASRGLPSELTTGARVPIAQGPVSRAIRERVPVMVPDWGREAARYESAIDPRWRETVIRLSRQVGAVFAIPLQVKDEIYGAFALVYPKPCTITDEEFQLGISIAAQAALAIETARLYEQERRIATLEERQRLARELHDSVSQALYGIQLEARSAHEWLQDDLQCAAERLDNVLSLTGEALAEMRAVIFELRPESLGTEGLVAALHRYAAHLRAQYGMQVQTVFAEEPAVSGDVKEALYRIAREALQNIVRHAHATRVELQLHRSPHELVMQVSDNGIGFDTLQSSPGHLGLHTMAERTAKVAGSFAIESIPSTGTFIRVAIPL